MTARKIAAWLRTLHPDAQVAVDAGGLTLVEVGASGYLEIGGTDQEAGALWPHLKGGE